MLITPWLCSMKSVLGRNGRKSSAAVSRRKRGSRSPVDPLTSEVEQLEDRTLLSVATFNPDTHVVRIEDPEAPAAIDDNIHLDVRFDSTPTHGAGIFVRI